MRATAIFPFAASRILFNEGEGREEEEKALVFRRPGSFFPLAAAGQDIRPRRKGAEEEGGGRTRDSTRIDTISLSLFSSSPFRLLRESKAARSAAFSSYWVPRTWEEGGRGRLHHAPTESRVFLGHEAADVSCEGREGREREIVEGPARDFDRPLGYLRDFSPARYVILFKIFSPFLFSPPPPRVEFDRAFFTSLVPRSTFRRH